MHERPGSSARLSSFAPIAAADARILILGSMPGVVSLRAGQYYAHPYNLFWPFMGELFDAGPARPYADRVERLKACGVAVWDVLQHCERPGSLDSAILRHSEVPNDFRGFFATHPQLRVIATNGGKAHEALRRHLLATDGVPGDVTVLALPSTSPANASQSRALKLARWRGLLDYS